MNKLYNNKYFILILSLILALVLFLYVKTDVYSGNARTMKNISENTTETLTDVPVNIQGNVDDKYITGLPDTVTVELTGPRNIIDQTIHTSNFKVVTEDLSDIGVGEHYIQLQLSGISSDVSYQISPSTVPITVSQLQSQAFPIQVIINNENDLPDGYHVANTETNPATVTLTGSSDTLAKVSRVYITVDIPDGQKESYSTEGSIIVEDQDGNILNITSQPSTIGVNIDIEGTGKEVPVRFRTTNGEEGVDYSIDPGDNKTVTIYGSQNVLNSINSISATVDVSGVNRQMQRSVELSLPNGVQSVEPDSFSVTVTPTREGSENSSSSQSGSSSRWSSGSSSRASSRSSD